MRNSSIVSNKSRINAKKTKEMVIDFSKIKQEIPALTLNNTEIDWVPVVKLLGVLIADNLCWEDYTQSLIKRCAARNVCGPRPYFVRIYTNLQQDST